MQDLLQPFLFYVFAGLAVVSACFVVTQNNPVRCVLALVLTFFASSILWLLAAAEFLALILVLVYVGAVMTLFLFVVMMLDIDIESTKKSLLRILPTGLIVVSLLVGLLYTAMPQEWLNLVTTATANSSLPAQTQVAVAVKSALTNTEQLGMVLYTDYVLVFELAAVILLVAIIAAITLAHRSMSRGKRQDVVTQIMTRKCERIELVQMKSEKNKG